MSDLPPPSANPTPAQGAPEGNGARALATLARYLEADGWNPRRLEGRDVFAMSYRGDSSTFHCYAHLRVDAEQLICYAVAPIRIPEERRSPVAEFVTRANYGMYIGNFELDFSDGEVRCKCSIDFEDEPLTDNLIRNAIYPAVRLLDTYLPGLIRVAYAGADPHAAVQEIEQSA